MKPLLPLTFPLAAASPTPAEFCASYPEGQFSPQDAPSE